MQLKKRILLIAQEFSPYLALTEFSEFIHKLAVEANTNNFEVRCIMPRFGCINERRYRLHEVLRLTGINIFIDNQDYPLQIKVASLPHSRLQIYFLDNVQMFGRETVFHDEENVWYADNGLRSYFFCKGALETVKKFGWPPDVIHCNGWFTSFVPFIIKKGYKKDPIFSNAKIMFSLYDDLFQEQLEPGLIPIIKKNLELREPAIEVFKPLTYYALLNGVLSHSDQVVAERLNLDKSAQTLLTEAPPKKVTLSPYAHDIKEHLALYQKYA